MKLSDSFDSDEFGTNLTANVLNNYYMLCLWVLQRVRERFGVVTITSGYRTKEDHERLKKDGKNPSETSQHLFGEAADFQCPYAESMGLVYRFILDELQFQGEVIYYKKRGHCHIALPRLGVKSDRYIDEAK